MKIKSLNKIRYFCLIDGIYSFYAGPLHIEPRQDTHVLTRIVIFSLSGKERDKSVIVKPNINQNHFCKGTPKYLFCPGPHKGSGRACPE